MVVAGILGGITYQVLKPDPTTTTATNTSYAAVSYYVTGTARTVSLTMETPGGGTSQQSGVRVPLTGKTSGTSGLHFQFTKGDFVYVSAQNDDATGSVTCSIEVDGIVVDRVTSSGAYVIASCSGRA